MEGCPQYFLLIKHFSLYSLCLSILCSPSFVAGGATVTLMEGKSGAKEEMAI